MADRRSSAIHAVADFNGDGKLDLAIQYYSSKNVSILLNQSTVPVTLSSYAVE